MAGGIFILEESNMQNKSHHSIRMLCEGAVMVVLAQLLGYLKLWQMPWGGTICLVMLPIFLFSCRWGLGAGIMSGLVLGILQFMFDGGIALGWQSIIGDYLLAFTALGLAGLFRGRSGGLFLGAVIGSLARFLVHYVVGATIWAAYMPEEFFGMTMTTPWFYSLLYNAAYMLPNLLITLLAAALLYRPLKAYISGRDLQ
jgi:thiamine transporter